MPLRNKLCFFLFFWLCTSAHATDWDVEYWQDFSLKTAHWGKFQLNTVGEIRFNHDISRFYYVRINENLVYHFLPYLDLEAHYGFIRKKPVGSKFISDNRLEFEVNPFVRLENGIWLKVRNRLELIKQQHIAHIRFILRHLFLISIPIENCGRLTGYSAWDEVFYNFDRKKFTQNRLVPLNLTFKIREDLKVDLFLMMRIFFSNSQWNRSYVIGTKLSF